MFVCTAKFSKKKAIAGVLALGALCLGLILLAARRDGPPAGPETLSTNADRVAYLESLGWAVAPDPVETLQLLLPETLEEPYRSYNELQGTQGFDLSACCGRQVTRYTYAVTNYPGRTSGVQVNLYLCGELPVAGDVMATGSGGFQATLVYPGEGNE